MPCRRYGASRGAAGDDRRQDTRPDAAALHPRPRGAAHEHLAELVALSRDGVGMPLWLGRALYGIELDGEISPRLVASRARPLRHIDAWDDRTRDADARMCADLATGISARLADWDAVIEPSIPEGPALLGFVARGTGGTPAYLEERERQARRLAERLTI